MPPIRPVTPAAATAAYRTAASLLPWLLLALLAAAPLPLLAQIAGRSGDGYLFRRPVISLTVRGGYDRPTAGSDIYDFTTTQLTLDKGDFAAGSYQIDLGVRLADRVDLVFGGGEARRTKGSEFRKYIDNDDQPIEQETALRRVPLTVGVRYALTSPGDRISRFAWVPARFTPWIGAGGGSMYYVFEQRGDFVDFETLDVFNRRFRSNGFAPMGYASLGADIGLTPRLLLSADLRYSAARAALSNAFEGFEKIDLSGTAATLGFTVRY
ncbi:MAG TPA: hypothetical protein VE861_16465 [Gemmatimonadaceae bacterium]|nr:hypothetical protein [Gemmatimonadaceae bacterium]